MLEDVARNLTIVLKDDKLQQYIRGSVIDLMQAVLADDPFPLLSAAKNIKEIVVHAPTIIFWDKMKRFFGGTFHSREDQIKMAQKFDDSDGEYENFSKRLIYLIDEMNDDSKIDYFAKLTRCFLYMDLDRALYFKLCKFISVCTPEELLFLKECEFAFKSKNTAMVSSLFQYGLFTSAAGSSNEGTFYVLSDFAKALKQNSLNFEDGSCREPRLLSYDELVPLNFPEFATNNDIDNIF